MIASRKDIQNVAQSLNVSIQPFFSRDQLNQLAKEAGFIRRESKLDGELFLQLIVFNAESLKNQSLNDLSIQLQSEHQVDITKQSLHERFNHSAVRFLKNALETLLQQQLDPVSHLPELASLNRILIKDSVCFQIDPSLAKSYPGSGGSGSPAAVRIQFEYDLKKGMINDLSLHAFNDQDATNALTTMELINVGDLIIRDLAYVGLNALKGVVKRHAYYLCRLQTNVTVYEYKNGQYTELNFVGLRKQMQRDGVTMVEKNVFLGKEDKWGTRLIIHLMPELEVAERLRKARANAKKKNRGELSAEYVARAYLNLFITNAKPDVIPAHQVWNLYRLRWQIELMFKIWKSVCHIEKVKKVKQSRLECYIYARLMIIVLGWQILWSIARSLYRQEARVISFYKAYKTLTTVKLRELRDVFIEGNKCLVDFMTNFYDLSKRYHILEKKKGKTTSFELLIGFLKINHDGAESL